jgi:hypothetical protein
MNLLVQQQEEKLKISKNDLYQARKVSDHVFMGIDFASFYDFSIGF